MIKIVDVRITTAYSWQSVRTKRDWNTVKSTYSNWQQLKQTSLPGEQITIEVELLENNWENISQLFNSWQDIKDSFSNWSDLKDW